jgi:hypothetical protein
MLLAQLVQQSLGLGGRLGLGIIADDLLTPILGSLQLTLLGERLGDL